MSKATIESRVKKWENENISLWGKCDFIVHILVILYLVKGKIVMESINMVRQGNYFKLTLKDKIYLLERKIKDLLIRLWISLLRDLEDRDSIYISEIFCVSVKVDTICSIHSGGYGSVN